MRNKIASLLFLALAFAYGNEGSFAKTTSLLPVGRYYIDRENIKGPEFADFDYFEIRLRKKQSTVLYTGKLFAKTNGGYAALPLRRITLSYGHLRFETSTVNGVRFSFDGQLMSQWKNRKQTACEKILCGKLKEIDDREGIVENEISFKYAPLAKEGSCS